MFWLSLPDARRPDGRPAGDDPLRKPIRSANRIGFISHHFYCGRNTSWTIALRGRCFRQKCFFFLMGFWEAASQIDWTNKKGMDIHSKLHGPKLLESKWLLIAGPKHGFPIYLYTHLLYLCTSRWTAAVQHICIFPKNFYTHFVPKWIRVFRHRWLNTSLPIKMPQQNRIWYHLRIK